MTHVDLAHGAPGADLRRPGTFPAAALIRQRPSGTGGPAVCGRPSREMMQRRWDLVLAHREELLAIARRRVSCLEDAEDVVATAMLRTVESPTLEESRVGSFLCTTVIRLTVDVHRDRARQLAIGKRQVSRELGPASAEDEVCDAAEARWLAEALAGCPERERQVLQARVAGFVGADVAAHLGLSSKSAENAYTRLRERAHKLLAATLSVLGLAAALGRRGTPAVGIAVPVALGILVFGIVLEGGGRDAGASVRSTALVANPPVSARAAHAPRPPSAPAPTATAAAAPPRLSRESPQATRPERVVTFEPAAVAPGLVRGGSMRVEDQPDYRDENFVQSVQRCLDRVDPTRPLQDPCA